MFKNGSNDTKLRTWVRGVSRLGTLCGVLAMVALISGCPPVTVTPCTDASECDDGNACTTDACTDSVCVNTAVECAEGETCVEGDCVATCADAADCDDGDLCTDDSCTDGACSNTAADCDDGDACTNDSCDPADGACVNDPVVCAAGEQCNADTGACEPIPCADDTECDDEDACNGVETCDTDIGVCSAGTAVDCDDGDNCTTDSCDPADGTCTNDAVVCADGEVCDPADGTCVASCTTDADCDDGAFCTGTETCDTATGVCSTGTNPCAEDQTCDEDTDTCTGGAAGTFNLTLAQDTGDDFVGGSGDDTFNAPLIFNSGTGTNLASLQTQDSIDGAGGNDTLNATFNAAANAVTPTVANIENIDITDFGTGTTTYSFTNTTGAGSITSVGSTTDVIVTNVPALANLGVTNSTEDLSATFLTAATSGSADAMTLALSNATGATTTNQTVTITTGTTNGVETLNISSTGAANSIKQVTQATGNTMTAVNVSGDMSLKINDALDNSITTVDCSGSSGGCNLTVGNGTITFTGGTGDDTVAFSGTDFTSTDTVDGGDGADTLSLLSADADNATAALTNVSNVEGLTVSDAMAGAVNSTFYGSIATVNLEAGITGGNTLTVADGTAINLGKDGATNNSAGNNTIKVGGLGTSDDVTVNYYDSDSGGSTTFDGVEAVTLNSNLNLSGAAADGGSNTFTGAFALPDVAGSSLTIGGSEDVVFSAAVTARTINASGFANKLTMTLNASGSTATSTVATGGGSITAGTGDDTLVGSTAGDTISGGGGKDVIQPGRGIDTVNFSDGSNTLDLEDLAVAQALSANRCTVTGFTANGTAFTTSNEVDAIRFDNLGTQGDLSDGAVAAEMQTITTPANVTVSAGVSLVELAFEVSSGVDLDNDTGGATLLSACGGTTGTTACTFTTNANDDDIVIIAYQSSAAYIYHGNGAGANTALIGTEINLIAVVTGDVTVGGFDVSQFIN